jgi:hypothetical protein
MRSKRYRLGALALGGLLAVAGVGVASGAIPSSSDGVIHGCYQKPGLLANPGAVRVIDAEAGQTCRNNETAFQWNSKGDPGPQGPAGVVTGREVRTVTQVSEGGNDNATALVRCPEGKVLLTGGTRVSEGPKFARLTMNEPHPDGQGWRGQAVEVVATNLPWAITVTVICVDG